MALDGYLTNPFVLAGLDVLAYCEGANYNTIFGGGSFSDYSHHPGRVVRAGGYASDAAGRYQFLNVTAPHTWRNLVSQYGFSDFSPRSQDLGAIALISQAGGLNALSTGDLNTWVARVRGIWPSLPGGRQQTRNWNEVNAYWQSDLAARGNEVAADTGGGDTGAVSGSGELSPPDAASGLDFSSLLAGGSIVGPLLAVGAAYFVIDLLTGD